MPAKLLEALAEFAGCGLQGDELGQDVGAESVHAHMPPGLDAAALGASAEAGAQSVGQALHKAVVGGR